MRLKRKLIKHIGTLPGGFHDSNPSGSLRKLIEKNTDATETMMAHQIPNTTMSIVLPILFNKGGNTMNLICSFVFFASIIPMLVTILKRIMGNSSESIIVDEAMESLKTSLSVLRM